MLKANISTPSAKRPLSALAAVSLAALLMTAGCTNLKPNMDAGKPLDSMSGEYKETDAHLKTAANDALALGRRAVGRRLSAGRHCRR